MCWTPNANPFTAAPTTLRLDRASVRIDWDQVFQRSSRLACAGVQFRVKSHPRFKPSAYQLSDLTERTSAVLSVDGGTDYVFQVIAREDKGPQHGIDYKYSPMVTSYATDAIQVDTNTDRVTVKSKVVDPPRHYRLPEVRSLPSIYDDYAITTTRPVRNQQSVQSSLEVIGQCMPLLRGGFGPGSRMQQDRLVINLVRYLNQRQLEVISDFLQTKKSCKESHKKGFPVRCQNGSHQRCCPTPWNDCNDEECIADFSSCNGRCFDRTWVNDGWPDCIDGSDESGSHKRQPLILSCVYCASVVLPAAHLCRASGRGLTAECVHDFIGEGECNVCVQEYLD